MNDSPIVLACEDVTLGYEHKPLLEHLSLTVRAGDYICIVGENGSGKSTLLRALCGMLPAQYERCALAGRDLPGMRARERAQRVAYIPQRCAIDPGLTAEEAVLMGANARTPLLSGYTAAQRTQARESLTRAGAGALAGRLFGTLSEGQRQLVVLARALMQQPRLFLLDEPDSALDLSRRYAVMDAVRAAMGTDCGALAVLHDAQLALSRCDRVFILKDGEIACALDMHAADEAQVSAAMALLSEGTRAVRVDGEWAVLGRKRTE